MSIVDFIAVVSFGLTCFSRDYCGMSSKIDPLFRLNLTHPNVFRVWVSFFIISDFYTVI